MGHEFGLSLKEAPYGDILRLSPRPIVHNLMDQTSSNPWVSLKELGKRFDMTAVQMGQALIELGYRLKETKAPTEQALKDGLAKQHTIAFEKPTYRWHQARVSVLLTENFFEETDADKIEIFHIGRRICNLMHEARFSNYGGLRMRMAHELFKEHCLNFESPQTGQYVEIFMAYFKKREMHPDDQRALQDSVPKHVLERYYLDKKTGGAEIKKRSKMRRL